MGVSFKRPGDFISFPWGGSRLVWGEKGSKGPTIVPWATGSDEEVAALIDAAHAGTIDLQQDAGWKVGDVRTISMAAWTGSNNIAHVAENLRIAITSFEEYEGCGNLFQFDFIDCPSVGERFTNNSPIIYEYSNMNKRSVSKMANAMPEYLKTRLRTFSVKSKDLGSGQIRILNGNKLALRSRMELFGTGPSEGVYVDYYSDNSTRIKKKGIAGSATVWWIRTNNDTFNSYGIGTDGTLRSTSPNTSTVGISPFGCI